jgi:hypothetical protein
VGIDLVGWVIWWVNHSNTQRPSHVGKRVEGIMVDIILDIKLRQSFDRAPCRASIELHAELQQSSV